MKIVIKWGDETLVRGNKNLVEGGGGLLGRTFLGGGRRQANFRLVGGGDSPHSPSRENPAHRDKHTQDTWTNRLTHTHTNIYLHHLLYIFTPPVMYTQQLRVLH